MPTPQTPIRDDTRPAGLEPSLPSPSVDPRPRLLNQPWVQDAVAFSSSLLFHLTIIVFGFLVVRELPPLLNPPQEQFVVPDITLIEGAEVGGIPNPGLGGDPTLPAAQNVDPSVTVSDGWSDKRSDTLTQNLLAGGGSDGEPDSMIGLGLRSGLGSGAGTGSGRGPGIGGGSGSGGAMAPFGVPGGGAGTGPRAPFMGISGNARNVAYVCDASGSMLGKFPALKHELRRSLDILRDSQWFSIIFFADPDRRPQAFDQTLVRATPDKKRQAHQFLDGVSVSGATDPIPGLELAFRQKPQLIYLLTDGDFPDNKAVLDRIRVLNRDKTVKINTVVFMDAANADRGIVELMKQIATENGGVFRIVSQYDL